MWFPVENGAIMRIGVDPGVGSMDGESKGTSNKNARMCFIPWLIVEINWYEDRR